MTPVKPLNDDVISEKQSILSKTLVFLSNGLIIEDSEKIFENCANDLVKVYSDDYRQFYSDIYPIIDDIYDGDSYNLEALLFNVESLRIHVRDNWSTGKYPDYLYGKLIKLSDHLTLEYQRYVEAVRSQDDMGQMIEKSKKLERDLSNANKKMSKMQTALIETREKAFRVQTEIVMILAIFAAIVMAFSGGLTLIGSSISGMSSTGPFKITFVVLLCGIVIFNTIAVLMHVVNKIVTSFYSSHSDDYIGGRSRKFSRIKAFNHWYVLLFNILLISMLVTDIIIWYNYGDPPSQLINIFIYSS